MANDTNMATNENREATVPIFEFRLPTNEIDLEAAVGDRGTIMIPVEVVAKNGGSFTFRKSGPAAAEGEFRGANLEEMRDEIGVVEDTEGE